MEVISVYCTTLHKKTTLVIQGFFVTRSGPRTTQYPNIIDVLIKAPPITLEKGDNVSLEVPGFQVIFEGKQSLGILEAR